MAVLPIGIGASGGPPGAQVSRSLRFNSADSAYLTRTPASAGNRQTWTWSGWVKFSISSTVNQGIFGVGNSASGDLIQYNNSSYNIRWFINGATSGLLETSQVFRDPSAWYHLVFVFDTTNSTSSDRMRIYVNGTRITSFSTATYPSQNYQGAVNTAAATFIGFNTSYNYFSGYLTEINFIDGQALTPSSFGQTNASTGVWEPIAYTGTYGANGFYVNFSDNSGTTATTLGKDYSGNGNNWTSNNFSVTAGVGNDSLVDTPTSYGTDTGTGNEVRGNYATWNALDQSGATINNGNLFAEITSGQVRSTLGMTTGKWYWEVTAASGGYQMIGVTVLDAPIGSADWQNALGYAYYAANGFKYNAGSSSSFGSTYTNNDVIGVALDADTGKIWFAKNGTWQASGNPAAGTNAAFTASSLVGRPFAAFFNTAGIQSSINANFGQRAFSYTAPSGFKALVTQNLPTPTIGATSTTQANDYFDITLRTTVGGTGGSITTLNFQPDFLWSKLRNTSSGNVVWDAVRGVDNYLVTNTTAAAATSSTWLTSFNSNGYTYGTGDFASGNSAVDWAWKANGAGVTNTSGTITSTVSVNSTSKFSIATYTGNATTGATVGHGLGVAPEFIFWKRRNSTSDWISFNKTSGHSAALYLNLTNANTTSNFLNNTLPSSTVVTLQQNTDNNANGGTYVMYSFASVEGFSKFGSYTGNGSTDGPFVYLGFRPRYILFKNTTGGASAGVGNWVVIDTARDSYNVSSKYLYPNLSNAEGTAGIVDITSNGFKLRASGSSYNESSATHIFAAFAESPFKYSLAR